MTFDGAIALIFSLVVVIVAAFLWVERLTREKPLKRRYDSARHLPPGDR